MRRVVPWLLVGLSFAATIAVSVGVSAFLSGGSTTTTAVIVDYSPTLSDVPALLYVAARPDVDLLAVTLPGTGESSCAAGVRHTRQLLALVGRGDVPVGCGGERPLSGDRDWPEPWRRSADTLSGLVLPDVPDVPTPDAVDLLVETIAASERPVTVLTLSSLTNLGALVRDHPEAVDGVERIVTMGGALDVLGNVEDEPSTEWNLYIDPEATRLVLESGIPLTLVPLDATNDVPGNRRLLARAQLADGHPAGVASAQLWRANADAIVGEGFYFWDELAATVTFEPDLVALERRSVVVIEGLGATVEDPGGTPILVAVSADQLRFEQHLLDTLNGAPLPAPAPVGEAERAYAEALNAGFAASTEEMRAAWSADPAPGLGPRDTLLAVVTRMMDSFRTLDGALAAATPPRDYASAHDEMGDALKAMLALEPVAVAALNTPEAAAAENPSALLEEAVGDRIERLGARFEAACGRIADDLLVRGGPELGCVPGLG